MRARNAVSLSVVTVAIILAMSGCDWFKPKKPDVPNKAVNPRLSIYAAPSDASGRVEADNAKMALGAGFDSVGATVKQQCVTYPADVLSHTNGAGESFWSLRTASDLNEVSELLDINAKASMGLGLYSGDASYSYVHSGHISKYGEHLILTQRVENQRQLIDPTKVRLTSQAAQLLKSGLQNFLAVCGDQFIYGQVQGGYLAATFELRATTDAEQETMRGALSGSAPFGSASGSVNKTLDSLSKENRLEFTIMRQGPIEDWPETSIEKIVEYARTFPSKVKVSADAKDGSRTAPWVTHYLMTGYDQLIGQQILSDQQTSFFQKQANYVKSLYARKSGLLYIKQNPSQFGSFSQKRLDDEVSTIDQEVARIRDLTVACGRNDTHCSGPQYIKIESLPDRNSGSDWVGINVASNEKKGIGGSYENDLRAIEVRGRWYPHCPNRGYIVNGVVLYFTSRTTGERHELVYPGYPVLIPAGYDVAVRVGDGPDPDNNPGIFADNCNVDGEPVQARSFVPVFPDELRNAF